MSREFVSGCWRSVGGCGSPCCSLPFRHVHAMDPCGNSPLNPCLGTNPLRARGLADPPTGYIDPSLLAGQYPPATRTLPNSFQAPDLSRHENYPSSAVGGGLLVLVGLGGLAWLASRSNRPRSRARR